MASIRERKGKFNVIYNYKDDSGNGTEMGNMVR